MNIKKKTRKTYNLDLYYYFLQYTSSQMWGLIVVKSNVFILIFEEKKTVQVLTLKLLCNNNIILNKNKQKIGNEIKCVVNY